MLAIEVITVGEVAFANQIRLTQGYAYDIPIDDLGIPYLPLRELMGDQPWLTDEVVVGFAHPDGYLGMTKYAHDLMRSYPSAPILLRALFTNDRLSVVSGYRVRSLKKDLAFYAIIQCADDQVDEIARHLRGITHLGVAEGDITGEVACSLISVDVEHEDFDASELCTYSSLEYTCEFLTPACFHAPYASGAKTQFFLPGSSMRRVLLADMGWSGDPAHADLSFGNAYIAHDGQRLLPLPLCMSVVKLDREQLRYRLSAGKDAKRVEQDVTPSHAFGRDFEAHMMKHVAPEAERIVARDGSMYDALCAGQSFKGVIYGSDEELRAIAAHLNANPVLRLGHLASEGYGEAYVKVDGMREDALPAEVLARSFDVACVSHVHLIDDEGMPSYDAGQLLAEIERLLGVSGRLEIVGRYTDVYKDFAPADAAHGVTRCLAMGSVMRVRTKDGQPIDIAPIQHAFVGERQREGYGEIIAYPAHDLYYRVTKRMEPQKYATQQREALRDMHFGAEVIHWTLQKILRQRVEALALIDRDDFKMGVPIEDLAPLDLLELLRDYYAPLSDREQLLAWYDEALREDENYAWRID